ncbi:hypothetical protein J6590_023607 [Homalodisca vitripennis]|nr:hypothetical protein J6590_023607 [Homalodisca vitripennis]
MGRTYFIGLTVVTEHLLSSHPTLSRSFLPRTQQNGSVKDTKDCNVTKQRQNARSAKQSTPQKSCTVGMSDRQCHPVTPIT